MIRLLDFASGLKGWRRALLVMMCGVMSALALPPINFWPMLFFSVPVFLAVLERRGEQGIFSSFLSGWLYGFGYFIFAFHWIAYAFFVDAATYLWMMPFAVGALAASMAAYWGIAAALTSFFGWQGLRLAIGFAVLLAGAEWLRGRLFTGFPWAAPGLAVDGMGATAQLVSVVGMTGLTLLVVLWAGLPLAMHRKERRYVAMALLALLPLGWAFGTYRLAGDAAGNVPGVNLRIVQPNIGQNEKWREDNARNIFDSLLSLSLEATADNPEGIGSRSHVIWPESAVPFLIDESPVAKTELARVLAGRTALITGAIRRDQTSQAPPDQVPFYNSIITFDGKAEVVARYDKWRLVPGGEFLPFSWLLEPLGFRRVVKVPGNFTAGPGPVTVSVPGAPPAAMLVCYEAIFPHALVDPQNRPEWIINVTNDGWFGHSTGPWQHLAQARLRAIEQGLPVVRAANTGISAVIDPYGKTLGQLGLGEIGVLDSALPLALASTIYGRFGDILFGILGALCLAVCTFGSRKEGGQGVGPASAKPRGRIS